MATRPGYIWSGTEWVSIGQDAIPSPFYYQPAAPTTASTGDVWVDSDAAAQVLNQNDFLLKADAATLYTPSPLTVIAAKTGAYTLANGDQNDLIQLNGTFTVTVPTDATYDFAIGTQINILNVGSGVITTAGASGVTLNGTPGLVLRAQWSSATFIKRAADTWVIVGDLKA